MNSTIQAIVGILLLVTAGNTLGHVYYSVKCETVRQVHRGLHSHLEPFTQKLTGVRLKY